MLMSGNLSHYLSLVAGALSAQAQLTITPLNSFGGGDGWLAPGEGAAPIWARATMSAGSPLATVIFI